LQGEWRIVQTEGSPVHARDCDQIAVVPVSDSPIQDLCSALPAVEAYSLASYAETRFAAVLARVLELRTGAIDLGRLGASLHREGERTRTAVVQGRIRMADGRSDPAFFGGQPRLLHDVGLWQRSGETGDAPLQIKRLRELEKVGVDVVEFPIGPAIGKRFGKIELAQPVVICRSRFRAAEANGRVTVRWA
jgi:hypothetical protein